MVQGTRRSSTWCGVRENNFKDICTTTSNCTLVVYSTNHAHVEKQGFEGGHLIPQEGGPFKEGDASQGNLEIKSDSTEKTSNSGSKEAASKKVGRGLPMGGVHPRWRQLPDHSPYGRSKKPRTLTSSLFLALSQLIFWFAIHLIIGRPNGQSLAVARPPRLVVRRRKLAATAR